MARLDKAIDAMNGRADQTGVRFQYSTPSRFAKVSPWTQTQVTSLGVLYELVC